VQVRRQNESDELKAASAPHSRSLLTFINITQKGIRKQK
jgi:hypothetical protein